MQKKFCEIEIISTFALPNVKIGEKAKVAQLVERNLAKVKVAGSRPVFRSKRAEKLFF